MNVQEAVALLRRHNEWRRGACGEMIEPRWLGLAIDLLCDHFSQAAEMVCLPPEIDPTSRVLDGIKYAPNFVSGWNRCRVAMIDATPAPVAHVGDSQFESWFSTYNPKGKGDKQRARDAYAAGMGDAAPVAQTVPDGFVLVPKEPTEDMLMDGCDAMTENHETANYGMCYGCGFKEVKAAWSAMLAAAQAQEGKP